MNFDTPISFHSVSSIFWQLSDKTRHFFSIILSLLYLCLQTCYLWASACILVCDLTSSERQNNWISILLFHFIQFLRYFRISQIKLGNIFSIKLSLQWILINLGKRKQSTILSHFHKHLQFRMSHRKFLVQYTVYIFLCSWVFFFADGVLETWVSENIETAHCHR